MYSASSIDAQKLSSNKLHLKKRFSLNLIQQPYIPGVPKPRAKDQHLLGTRLHSWR